MSDYGGSWSMRDGTRVAMTSEEAQKLWEDIERKHAERAERLPDETAALKAMFDAYDRLRELGWREAIYCPKDGSTFEVIEAGSTSIFHCHYEGEWPDGHWWAEDGGDLWPSRPILFRLLPQEEEQQS